MQYLHTFSTKKLLILVMTLLLAFITVLLSLCYYVFFRQEILTQLSNNYTDQLQLFSQQFDSITGGAKTIAQLLYQGESITGTLLSSVNDVRNNFAIKGKLDELYSKYDHAFQQARLSFEIVCFSENGFSYSTENLSDEEIRRFSSYAWFTKQKALNVRDYTISNFANPSAKTDSGFSGFAVVKNIYNTNESYAGSIIVYVPEIVLRSVYEEFSSEENLFFLLNENSVVISSNDPESIGTTLGYLPDYRFVRGNISYSTHTNPKGIHCFSVKYFSSFTGWTVYEQLPLSAVLAPLHRIVLRITGITFACFAVILLIIIVTASYISRPLNKIILEMESSIDNHFARIHIETHIHEVASIADCYNHLSSRITGLLQDIRASEKKAADDHFRFLKAQINPHFLYNTLFSIKCMISMNENQKASQMIMLLIALLKDAVGSNQTEHALLDETAILSQYVKLQNLRYNNNVRLQIDLPEAMAELSIPRFLMQPLVENVFLHAIPISDTSVNLMIRFRETAHNIYAEVCDTGVGFSPEAFHRILENTCSSASSHIGLCNIQDQIHTLYGLSYGLSLEEDPHYSTVIRITIPRHYGGEYHVSNFSS